MVKAIDEKLNVGVKNLLEPSDVLARLVQSSLCVQIPPPSSTISQSFVWLPPSVAVFQYSPILFIYVFLKRTERK